MITDLPANFVPHLQANSRKPVLLLHINFPGLTLYYSDREITVNNHNYQALVESWGRLRENVDIRPVLKGGALEARTMKISVFKTEFSVLSQLIWRHGIENITVDLFLWFTGEPATTPTLVDTFVIQDEIQVSEASIKTTLELVSVIMRDNPYLVGDEYDDRYPYVLSHAEKLPLIDLQTTRWTTLVHYVDHEQVGHFYLENITGFPAQGAVWIGNERLQYQGLGGRSINITQRGNNACQHSAGVRVYLEGNYDYAVCTGPVSELKNLRADGSLYTNEYEFFPDENPAIVRFTDRPPYHDVVVTNPGGIVTTPITTIRDFGSLNEVNYGNGTWPVTNPDNINNDSDPVVMQISHDIDGGESHVPYTFSSIEEVSPSPNIIVSAGLNSAVFGFQYTSDDYTSQAAHIIWNLNYDFSNSGPFSSDSVEVVGQLESGSRFGFIKGTITWKYTDDSISGWEVFASQFFDNNTGIIFFPWEEYNAMISEKADSWADLESAQVMLEVYVERIYTPDANQPFLHINFDNIFANVKQVVDPQPTLNPWHSVATQFGHSLPGTLQDVKAEVAFYTTLQNAYVKVEIFTRATPNSSEDLVLWYDTYTTSPGQRKVTVDVPATDMSSLWYRRVGLKQTITGPNDSTDPRVVTTLLQSVTWLVTLEGAETAYPPEEDISWTQELSVDVVAMTGEEKITPAKAVELILKEKGFESYIDTVRFAAAHGQYVGKNFYISGAFDRDVRFHDAIKYILKQGMGRLIYNQGKIGMISFERFTSSMMSFTAENFRLKSFREKRANFDLTFNSVIVYYDHDFQTNNAGAKEKFEDVDSIDRYEKHELKLDFEFVHDADVAAFIAEHLVNRYKIPPTELTFSTYYNAYQLEKGDYVTITTDFGYYKEATGEVLTIERRFGSGKTKQPTIYDVTILTPSSPQTPVWLFDQAQCDDNDLQLTISQVAEGSEVAEIRESLVLVTPTPLPNETAEIDDSGVTADIAPGYGLSPYGVINYGY